MKERYIVRCQAYSITVYTHIKKNHGYFHILFLAKTIIPTLGIYIIVVNLVVVLVKKHFKEFRKFSSILKFIVNLT